MNPCQGLHASFASDFYQHQWNRTDGQMLERERERECSLNVPGIDTASICPPQTKAGFAPDWPWCFVRASLRSKQELPRAELPWIPRIVFQAEADLAEAFNRTMSFKPELFLVSWRGWPRSTCHELLPE